MKCSRFLRFVAALSLCLCVLFSNLLCARAETIVRDPEAVVRIDCWTKSSSGSWVTGSSTPNMTTKYYCWRLVMNSSVKNANKSFSFAFNILSQNYGIMHARDLTQVDLFFRDGTSTSLSLENSYTSGVVGVGESTYSFFGKTYTKDIAYIDLYFTISCPCTSCTHSISYTSVMLPEETVQEVIKEEIKVSNNILENIKSIVTYIGNLPSNIANSISGYFTSLGTSINNKLQTLYNSLPAAIKDKLESLFTGIQTATNNVKTAVSDIGTNIVTSITALPSNIKTQLTTLFTNLGTGIDNVKTAVGNIGTNIVTSITALPSNISGFFTNLGTSVGGFIDSGVERILTGIKGFFLPSRESLLTCIDKWESLLDERFTGFVECRDMVLSYYDTFLSYKESSTVVFPKTEIPLLGYTFPFGGWEVRLVPEGFEPILGYAKWIVSAVCTLSFVNVMHVKFDKFLGVLT